MFWFQINYVFLPRFRETINQTIHMTWQDNLTIIVTTSPVKSNPDTALLEEVMNSILFCPGLVDCRKIIVCDGVNQVDDEKKPLWKSGRVTTSHVPLYQKYKENLQELARVGRGAFAKTEILELETRSGFGVAALSGVRLANTEYVMVIQHDRRFTRPLNVGALLADMDLAKKYYSPDHVLKTPYHEYQKPITVSELNHTTTIDSLSDEVMSQIRVRYPMNYVCLTTSFTMQYTSRVATKFGGLDVDRHSLPCPNMSHAFIKSIADNNSNSTGNKSIVTEQEYDILTQSHKVRTPQPHLDPEAYNLLEKPQDEDILSSTALNTPRLTPMTYWFDSTHIARKDFYETFIFGRYLQKKTELIRKGEFIEDKLIQFSLSIFAQAIEQGKSTGVLRRKSGDISDDDEDNDKNIEKKQLHYADEEMSKLAEKYNLTENPHQVWNILLPKFQKDRDLRNYGQWIAKICKLETPHDAMDIIAHEFGLWLLEDFQGRTYNVRGVWMMPRWLEKVVTKYALTNRLSTKYYLNAPKNVSKAEDDAEEKEKDDALDERCVESEQYIPSEIVPLFRKTVIDGLDSDDENNVENSNVVPPPWGYVGAKPPTSLVGHLDGKKFWNSIQRRGFGYENSRKKYVDPATKEE